MEESKEKLDEVVLDASSDSPDETINDTMEYSTKLKLVMTVVALVLSMFLVS
jgi:hypothetical protein